MWTKLARSFHNAIVLFLKEKKKQVASWLCVCIWMRIQQDEIAQMMCCWVNSRDDRAVPAGLRWTAVFWLLRG